MVKDIVSAIDAEIARLKQVKALLSASGVFVANASLDGRQRLLL